MKDRLTGTRLPPLLNQWIPNIATANDCVPDLTLTASRPDLRVFRIATEPSIWVLWYPPKDTAMALTAYADADNADYQQADIFTKVLPSRTIQIHSSHAWHEVYEAQRLSKEKLQRMIRMSNEIGFKYPIRALVNLTQDTLRDALQITPVDNNRSFSSPPTPDTLVEFVNKLGILLNPSTPSQKTKRKLAQLNLGNEEATLYLIHVSGHLKFSAKGSKREVFGMTILNELINDVIRGANYYDAYLEKVAKHQRYIAGEELSDPESPAPKLAKPTKQAKLKTTEQPTISKTKAKKSKPAPTKPKEKKRKLVLESSEAQPLAKRAKVGKVVKKRTVKSSKQLVDEFIDEGVPAAKPSLEDTEEAILQKVLQESLTDAYPTQKGPLPSVVFRETDTGKFQPLPEVPGKEKEKVGEEQAAQVLLNLQTPKKKSSAEQYIFQRRYHVPTETASHEDSSSLYAELGLYGSDTESDEEMPLVVRSRTQDEGQAGADPGTLDEGQAGSDPGTLDEGQAGADPGTLDEGQAGSDPDVEITDPSSQPQLEHMDEGFTATAYPNVQENLNLTVDEQVIPEEPVSSTGELSSLQHLAKDFSFGDQFLNDKPFEAYNEKTTADTEAESMIKESVKEVVISSVKHAMRAPLRARFKDLPTSDIKEILLQRMLEENYDKGHANHRIAYKALQDSIRHDESEDFDVDKAQEETKKKSKQDSPNTSPGSPPSPPPPPPPPLGASRASGITGASKSVQAPPPPPPSSSTHQGDQSTGTIASSSSKTAASAEYSVWTTIDTRIKPSITLIPDDLYMDDETTADEQVVSSDDEVRRDHIPTVNLRQSWWKPLTEDRPATLEPAWTIPSSDLSMPTNN
ncbi:hypothetical protein Tco_1036277 [Tanacetum coccineum]